MPFGIQDQVQKNDQQVTHRCPVPGMQAIDPIRGKAVAIGISPQPDHRCDTHLFTRAPVTLFQGQEAWKVDVCGVGTTERAGDPSCLRRQRLRSSWAPCPVP